MHHYSYEFVQYDEGYQAKIFVTSLEYSKFHWHYEYEIVFVLSGSVKVNVVPNPVVLQEGQFILLNGQMMHEVQKTESENVVLFIQISPKMFLLGEEQSKEYYFYLNCQDKELEPEGGFAALGRKIAVLGYLSEKQKRNHTVRLRTRAVLYDLIADLLEKAVYDVYQSGSQNSRSEEANRGLEAFIQYIEEHFKEEYVLEDLCARFGISEKSIHRQLKKSIGLSARELVEECRIKEAEKMLKYTDKPISVIADLVGFNSDKTFYRVFKKQIGITPSEYRKHGEVIHANEEIRGYMGIDHKEIFSLLKKYMEGCWADD